MISTGLPKENQIHGFLAEVVELVKMALGNLPQLLHLHHLNVILVLILWVGEVAEQETSKVVLDNFAVLIEIEMGKEFVEVLLQVGAGDILHELDQPTTVAIVDETIIVNTEHLVVY